MRSFAVAEPVPTTTSTKTASAAVRRMPRSIVRVLGMVFLRSPWPSERNRSAAAKASASRKMAEGRAEHASRAANALPAALAELLGPGAHAAGHDLRRLAGADRDNVRRAAHATL